LTRISVARSSRQYRPRQVCAWRVFLLVPPGRQVAKGCITMPAPSKKRMRSCHDGKRRYNSLDEAKAAASAFARKKAKTGSPIVTFLRAYGCACGGFHIGKTRGINWDLVREVSQPVRLSQPWKWTPFQPPVTVIGAAACV